MTILVTGSTGTLGTPTLAALRAAGHDARGFTRSGRDDSAVGDLFTGAGVAEAFRGVDTVVHCAQSRGKNDVKIAENLMAAAASAGVGHLVLISIVDIDRIPMAYYRQRLDIERVAQSSSVPLTIQRATQFHTLIDQIFRAQKYSPVLLAPGWRCQPIAVEEVAGRLAELAAGAPQGRVPDIGGPQQRTMRDLLTAWKTATGSRRPGVSVRLPGKMFAAYDMGAGLVPGQPFGEVTFDDYLARKYAGASVG
jgi:uncharacterized protein YbjT (DUF2867 family)